MNLEFITIKLFDELWGSCGLNDDALKSLQDTLLSDPENGEIIQGTGGARKMRIPLLHTGKRGGARVIYVYFADKKEIYFILVYRKAAQKNLSLKEKNSISKLGRIR